MDDGQLSARGSADPGVLAGVIEGFYGRPWTSEERRQLFDWMAALGLSTYVYAPKDDLKHRALWREPYSATEAEVVADTLGACHARGLRFIGAVAPGLDIRYSREEELGALVARFEQLVHLGVDDLALLFDDVPDHLHPEDEARWGALALAQCHVANAAWAWVRRRKPGARLLLCPTPYCERMVRQGLGGPGYLEILGRELDAGIDIFWTGPDIVSREISTDHIRELQRLIRRKPVIWDNLHANDYDARRFYCGPYAGRPLGLRPEVSGILINPNCEFGLNEVPIRTFGAFVHAQGGWPAREEYVSAMAAWLTRFDGAGQRLVLEDLVLLGDCFYLPHEDGQEAAALLASARRLVTSDPAGWGSEAVAFLQRAGRLKRACAAVAELRDRRLAHALFRPVWELREELDLLMRYVQDRLADPNAPLRSDFHLPGTYRGSFVARLQQLLDPQPDGTFVASAARRPAGDAPGA